MKKQQAEERLVRAVERGTFSHAYIIEGPKEGAKAEIAETFARRICQEEIIRLQAEGNSIRDEDVEEMQSRLGKKPFLGDRNVAIIEDADTMTLRAQNRLLKTLEEPPGHGMILLLSENVENLLPTILSRCIVYRLDEDEGQESENAALAAQVAERIGTMLLEGKPFYEINGAWAEVLASRERAYAFLDALELWYRDLLLAASAGLGDGNKKKQGRLIRRKKLYEAVALIEEARREINRNINTGYAMKSMLLRLMG